MIFTNGIAKKGCIKIEEVQESGSSEVLSLL